MFTLLVLLLFKQFTMSNKALQGERKRRYFIEATKEILKGEGSKALSVRNIAERAGYSYATLYNYFKDQTELVSLSLLDFKDECRDSINTHIRQSKPGKEEIRSIVMGYVQYFVQYPGVFDLFYIEKLASKSVCDEVNNFLDDLCAADWDYLIQEEDYDTKQVSEMRLCLTNAVIGLLISYLKRNTPSDYRTFITNVEVVIGSVLVLK